MGNNNLDLSIVIDKISKERSIEKQKLIDVIENAYLRAARKKWPGFNFETEYKNGNIHLHQIIRIEDKNNEFHADVGDDLVFDVNLDDPDRQVKLQEKYPNLKFPDVDGSFGRIAINEARDALQNKISGLNKERAYKLYKGQEGKMVSGKVRYVSDEEIAVDLGKVKAVLPYTEILPYDQIKPRDKVSAIIKEINSPQEDEQIILSRADEGFVASIMKEEVEELNNGRIEIVDITRLPGKKSKVAVRSNERGLTAVGPCIGYYGNRINKISDRLQGESVDIVEYSNNIKRYTKNALGIDKCICTEKDEYILVQLSEEDMSKAIGKNGINVKLASDLIEREIRIEEMNL